MNLHDFARTLAAASAALGLTLSAFLLFANIATVGVYAQESLSRYAGAHMAAAAALSADAERKADLQALAAALELYRQKHGTYTIAGAGSGGVGSVSFQYPGSKTIIQALYDDGDLTSTTTGTGSYYLLYVCNGGQSYAFSAKLDAPSAADISWIQASCNGTGANGTNSVYGLNYAVTEKGPTPAASQAPTTPLPSCAITYSPGTLAPGQNLMTTWSASNATSRTWVLRDSQGALRLGPASVSLSGSIPTDTGAAAYLGPGTWTRTDTVTGPGGTATCSSTLITLSANPAPTCTITYWPATVAPGQNLGTTWTSANATSRTWVLRNSQGVLRLGPASVTLNGSIVTDTNAATVLGPGTWTRTDTVTGPGGTANCSAPLTTLSTSTPNSDAQRKADLQTLAAALKLYYQKHSTYLNVNAGAGGGGVVNYVYGTSKTIIQGLYDDGDLSSSATLPANPANGGDYYMLYLCNNNQSYALSAKLDAPSAADISWIQNSCNGTGSNGTYSVYGRNYAVTERGTTPPPLPPSCSISYSPGTVVRGSGTPLTTLWTSQNAASRSFKLYDEAGALYFSSASTSLNGTTTTPGSGYDNLSGVYTRVDTVVGSGGTTTCSTTLTVVPPPTTSYCGFIDKGSIVRDSGNQYHVDLDAGFPADTTQAPAQSSLVVYENKAALGPGHSSLSLIQSTGAGRYSYFFDTVHRLYFSTSDNTDPRTNDRTYEYGGSCRVAKQIDMLKVSNAVAGYATFQSNNQKMVTTPYGTFFTFFTSASSPGPGRITGDWKLMRSQDGGASFQTVYTGQHVVSGPTLDADQSGNLYLFANDASIVPGATFFKFSPSNNFAQPVATSSVPEGDSGKYAAYYDSTRNQLYYFTWDRTKRYSGGNFWTYSTDGVLLRRSAIVADTTTSSIEYPHLAMMGQTLIASWTTNDVGGYHYKDIHTMASDDGGITWRRLDGIPLATPVVADDATQSGATEVVPASEFTAQNWLANSFGKGNALHLFYWSQGGAYPMHHVKYDLASGLKTLFTQAFRGANLSIKNIDGFFTSKDSTAGTRLYAVSAGVLESDITQHLVSGTKKRVFVLASDDNGATWFDYAYGPIMANPYAIGGSRFISTTTPYVQGFVTDLNPAEDDSSSTGPHNISDLWYFRVPAE